MIILGLDPGVSTGWGLVQAEKAQSLKVLRFGTTLDQSLLELEEQFQEADRIVIENWKVRPKEARKGSFDWDPMITPQVIGAAKLLSRLHGKPAFEQSPADKPMGYGFLRQKYVKGKKGMHSMDALAHAAFYCVKNNLALPVGL